MAWQEIYWTTMSAASGTTEFAIHWLMQSTLLIVAGLVFGVCVRRKGSALQSLIYRTTLIAVLVCPLATRGLSKFGVSGWTFAIPAVLTSQVSEVSAADNAEPLSTTMIEAVALDTAGHSGQSGNRGVGGADLPEMATSESIQTEPAATTAIPGAHSFGLTSTGQEYWVDNESDVEKSSTFGLLTLTLAISWIFGSGILLAKLACSWWRMSGLLRTADIADESTRSLCDALALQLGIRPPVVMRTPFVSSPCLASINVFGSPNILLPEDESNLPLRDVLVHELAHLRRRDCGWNWVRQIATAVYFFQPLLWLLSRRIEMTAEEVCDDIVVQSGGDRHDYAHRLVDIAELSTDYSAAAVAAAGVGIVSLRSMLARRVDRILDPSRRLSTRVSHALLIVVFLIGIAGTVAVGLVGFTESPIKADEKDSAEWATEDPSEQVQTIDDNHLWVRVQLPDGQPSSDTHIAVTGYDRDAGKMVIYAAGKTGADGHCVLKANSGSLAGRPDDVRLILARRDGYGVGWETLPLTNADRPTAIDVKLYRQGIVEGKLIDIEGRPAAGETLQVRAVINPAANPGSPDSGAGFRSAPGNPAPLAWLQPVTTDKDGRFRLTGVPENFGVNMALVESKAFAPQEISLNTGQSETRGERDATYRPLVKNTEPGDEPVLTLAPAKAFTGTVTYEDTGEPVAGSKIAIWAGQQEYGSMMTVNGVTDEKGRYRVLPSPGIRFGVTAYPPTGVPYMARKTERIAWENSDLERTVDIVLPRVVLVRGRILEEGTDRPVAGATITYRPDRKRGELPANVVTGWQAKQMSDEDGRFTFAVPRGRGTLMIKKVGGNYVLRQNTDRQLALGRPGGRRVYAHAFHEITPGNDESLEIKIRVKPGSMISGRILDEQGKLVPSAFVISNLGVWDLMGEWRGDSRTNVGGTFELSGADPQTEYSVSILDPHQKLGATLKLRGGQTDVDVVLQPCGSARAKFVVKGDRPFSPTLYFVATPGSAKYDYETIKRGAVAADSDFNANVDRVNYREPLIADDAGFYTFPALIPGATYRLFTHESGRWSYKDFSVQPGETLDLGEFTPQLDD